MRVLVLSPHTDDSELGSGGTIIKMLELGYELYFVIFSTTRDSNNKNEHKDVLYNEFISVMDHLKISKNNYDVYDFPVRELYSRRQDILENLVKIKKDINPDLVIGPSINDFHQDHQVVANEMIRSFKTTSSIISYELPWNHITFNTQLFIRLNKNHIKLKWKILKKYSSQIKLEKKYFSEDFIYGLAKARGVQCNSDYAETYEVIRWMI